MSSANSKRYKVNPRLTQMIVRLHELGFTEDYAVGILEANIPSASSGKRYFPGCKITLISQFYDYLAKKLIYLHTAELSCGDRGILVSDSIIDNVLPDTLQLQQLTGQPTATENLILIN